MVERRQDEENEQPQDIKEGESIDGVVGQLNDRRQRDEDEAGNPEVM